MSTLRPYLTKKNKKYTQICIIVMYFKCPWLRLYSQTLLFTGVATTHWQWQAMFSQTSVIITSSDMTEYAQHIALEDIVPHELRVICPCQNQIVIAVIFMPQIEAWLVKIGKATFWNAFPASHQNQHLHFTMFHRALHEVDTSPFNHDTNWIINAYFTYI